MGRRDCNGCSGTDPLLLMWSWRDPMNWSTRYESASWVGLVQVAAYSAGVRSPNEECGR